MHHIASETAATGGHSSDAGPTAQSAQPPSRARTWALWLAIGTLVAAALLGGFFIVVGDQAAVAGRAWLTLLLMADFAGAVVLDATIADGPNRWYVPASVIVNVSIVLIGLFKIWNGWLQPANTAEALVWGDQLLRLVAIIVVVRVALLVTQVYGLHFVSRGRSPITRVSASVSLVFAWLCALFLAIPAAFPQPHWPDWWWRTSGAMALVAVVLATIPLIVRAFEPRESRAEEVSPVPHGYAPPSSPGWPPARQVPTHHNQAAYPQPPAPPHSDIVPPT